MAVDGKILIKKKLKRSLAPFCFTILHLSTGTCIDKVFSGNKINYKFRNNFKIFMEEAKNFYLTKKGLEKIKKEYKYVKSLILSKTTGEEAPKILESEDLNPDFISYKEDIDFLENKEIELEAIIENAKIISPPDRDKIGFVGLGAIVDVETEGNNARFTVVGTLEADPALGKISNESPVGRALMGKKVGEEAIVGSPGKVVYKIKNITYHQD